VLVEHALADKLGPPDLSSLEGFNAPAVTQYTATTPDLLHSFRKYNAGKSYRRQVRPFGFMVMFQQADDAEQSTMMRVIAPFNRNPAKAARKAFNRDTDAVVRPKQLKTYAASLRTYYNHPEAKFLNGERGDRGPTLRRHIIARSIVHIGKEANKLDIQAAAGVDPDAQVEFHVDVARAGRLKVIVRAVKQFGPARVAREAGLSRKHISAIAGNKASVSDITLSKIERAISGLEIAETKQSRETAHLLHYLRTECEQVGLRQAADKLAVCPSVLSRVVAGQRGLSKALARRIKGAFQFK
jgi:plasmid maintenance system antidote protein VapI